MKKFFINIILYSVVIILFFWIITIVTDQGLKKSNFQDFEEWNCIMEGRVNADVLIQGTSRARWQYNTFILDSVLHISSYNLGMDAAAFETQYLRYKIYMQNNKPPKLIIQNVDWNTMAKYNSLFREYQFFPYLNNKNVRISLRDSELFPKINLYLPFLKYSKELKIVAAGFSEFFNIRHYPPSKHKGYVALDNQFNERVFEGRKTETDNDCNWDISIEELFTEFLDDCKARGIQVILVLSPPYYEIKPYMKKCVDMESYYGQIAEHNSVDLLDYSDLPMSQDKYYYSDPTHMNKYGAELFSLTLANDLKQYFY